MLDVPQVGNHAIPMPVVHHSLTRHFPPLSDRLLYRRREEGAAVLCDGCSARPSGARLVTSFPPPALCIDALDGLEVSAEGVDALDAPSLQ